jgi:hypothetical protein
LPARNLFTTLGRYTTPLALSRRRKRRSSRSCCTDDDGTDHVRGARKTALAELRTVDLDYQNSSKRQPYV